MEVLEQFQLADKEFNYFRELIYSEAGINLSDMKKALVRSRLTKRLRNLKISTFEEYYKYLVDHYTDEKGYFINAITTNKTDFFREPRHFEYIMNELLPRLEEMGKEEIKIWSAASSTGEEPYTIAITLLEYFKNKKMPAVKILATDIDTQVLEKGKAGLYTQEQVEVIDFPVLKRYFLRGKGENKGFFKIKDSVKKLVFFRQLNLQDEKFPMKGQFDMIFCRNVIIYFDRETQVKIFKRLANYLADHGNLFIGHSENITSFSDDFYLIGNTIYKKTV